MLLFNHDHAFFNCDTRRRFDNTIERSAAAGALQQFVSYPRAFEAAIGDRRSQAAEAVKAADEAAAPKKEAKPKAVKKEATDNE